MFGINRLCQSVLLAGLLASLCGGCGQEQERAPEVLRKGAQAMLMAGSYDQALSATENDDIAALEQAVQHLERTNAPKEALGRLVASIWGTATIKNELGYPMADLGKSRGQYQAAEQMTREAVQMMDICIRLLERMGETNAVWSARYSRSIIRDSVAWALYRLNRFDEALREQRAAVAEAIAVANARGRFPISGELHYHLGEIYRAMDRDEEARDEYEKALRLEPEHEPTRKALQQLP